MLASGSLSRLQALVAQDINRDMTRVYDVPMPTVAHKVRCHVMRWDEVAKMVKQEHQ